MPLSETKRWTWPNWGNTRFIGLSIIFFLPLFLTSQVDSTITLTFDFNEKAIKEKNDKVVPKPVGVSLTYDRFGNEDHAAYILGHSASYLSLGTSPLFKSSNITISLWVKLERKVYIGSGYEANPILSIKNSPGSDFSNALAIGYDWSSKRLGVNSTKDSTEDVTILAIDTLKFNTWNHLVFVCNNNYVAFYMNGELQGKAIKKFETKFLESDSLVLGHSADKKNRRYSQGTFDDIQIFHRPLSRKEIIDLYKAPNPNELKNILNAALKYIVIILILVIIIIALIIRNRFALKKQKEELQLATKISELELKAVKAQMNPHFISNCMAAIQNLIYSSEIQKAGLYVAKFSFFLRQVLNYSDENYIPLSQEIEMIKLFIELEQLRFKNGFESKIIIDPQLNPEDILIPSLITQPFIENAIWHGLLPLKNQRTPELTVRVSIKDRLPIIEVEDNGVGREPDKKIKKKNKGTQLVLDKIDTLNRLSKTSNYKIEIIDLNDNLGNKSGTKIVIHLDNLRE